MELTWQKEAAGSYYATNKSGQVVATARKEGNAWHTEVAKDNRVRQVGTYKLAQTVAARVLEDQRWEQVRAENLTEGDTLRFVDGEGTVTGVEPVGNNLGQLRVSYVMEDGTRYSATFYPGSRFERLRKPEPAVRFIDEQGAQELAEGEADRRDAEQAEETPAPAFELYGMQTIDLHPFVAIVDMIAGTGVLVSPPASEDVTLSEGGASLHDSLCADALRRLAPLGVEALEGEDGGLSLEGVTKDGRKVFSLYVSDCITTEPDFEEVAVSIDALRQAAGL
ncbi:hypothetical protein ABZT23_28040 [Streptomyces sp. NPDC005386]|uniref:hypothetical protein n=1 Tax=Streptomyces sp. NPDC005386 TaxID=3154562 RepID=UPI0033A3B8D1